MWISLVPLLSGCHFYVLSVNDFSLFSWLYSLVHKSEVFQCFVKFKLFVEKQFLSVIEQIQIDNGAKYVSNQFKTYLSQNVIFNKLICPPYLLAKWSC